MVTSPATVRLSCCVGLLCAELTLGGCERGHRPAAQDAQTPLARQFLDEVRQASASPDVQRNLAENPHNLFRFINQAWMRTVCEAFADEARRMPTVRLHGDAHLEQYALTTHERGLDDFDDSTTGPAVMDLVRFIGSIRLAAFQRGWQRDAESIVDAFLDGYRRGLADPAYVPADPAVVTRRRQRPVPGHAEFMAQAESLMRPLPAPDQARFDAAWPKVVSYAREANPRETADRLRVKRVGWLRIGIGSALGRKLLIRIEGPSPASEDDLIVEGKEIQTLSGVPCLTLPASGELFRVVEGLSQVGRLQHAMVIVVPIFPAERPNSRGWWARTWRPSYQELQISDFASTTELAEVAHDVGAQLGSTNLLDLSAPVVAQKRRLEFESLRQLEPRIRSVADALQRATIEAWQALRVN